MFLLMAPESRRVTLPARREYIFELEQAEAISIKLVEGAAEVFGYELAQGVDHGFSDECRAAIFSWNGAEIEIGLWSLALVDSFYYSSMAMQPFSPAHAR